MNKDEAAVERSVLEQIEDLLLSMADPKSDPNDAAADAVTVFEVWQQYARRLQPLLREQIDRLTNPAPEYFKSDEDLAKAMLIDHEWERIVKHGNEKAALDMLVDAIRRARLGQAPAPDQSYEERARPHAERFFSEMERVVGSSKMQPHQEWFTDVCTVVLAAFARSVAEEADELRAALALSQEEVGRLRGLLSDASMLLGEDSNDQVRLEFAGVIDNALKALNAPSHKTPVVDHRSGADSSSPVGSS